MFLTMSLFRVYWLLHFQQSQHHYAQTIIDLLEILQQKAKVDGKPISDYKSLSADQIKELIDGQAIGDIRMINLKLFQKPGSNQIAQTEENWRINPALSGGGGAPAAFRGAAVGASRPASG